jgi:ankyrin repeat protein
MDIKTLLNFSQIMAQNWILKNDEGVTELIYASQHSNAEIVKLLLEKGANPDSKDNEGKKALDYAYNHEVRNPLLK